MVSPGSQRLRLWSHRIAPARVARRMRMAISRRLTYSGLLALLVSGPSGSRSSSKTPILLVYTNSRDDGERELLLEALCSLRQVSGVQVVLTGALAEEWKGLCRSKNRLARLLSRRVTPIAPLTEARAAELAGRAFALLLPPSADDRSVALLAAAGKSTHILAPNTPECRGRCRENAVYYDISNAQSVAFALRRAVDTLAYDDIGVGMMEPPPAAGPPAGGRELPISSPDTPLPAYSPELPLYFLHIPKSAGTSVRVLLEDLYRSDDVCYAYYPSHLAALPPEHAQCCKLYRGHFGGALYPLLESPVNTVAWVRSPLSLLLSNFTFRIQEHVIPETMTLDEWLETNEPNPTCAYLTRGVSFTPSDPSQTAVDKARAVLQRCFMLGLVERHADSLNLLCYNLGAYPPEIVAALNRSRAQTKWDAHPKATREAAERLVGGDQELYSWARTRFDIAMAEMCEALKPDVAARFGADSPPTTEQIRAVLRDRFFRRQADTPLSGEIDYTFDQPMIGEGWFERQPGERDSLIGCIRGIAGETGRASLFLPIRRDRACTLRFGVARIYTPEALRGLKLAVNGEDIPVKPDGAGHPRLLCETAFRADIPAAVLQKAPHLSQLMFIPGGSVVPAERDPFQRDTSALTLALNWVSVKSLR